MIVELPLLRLFPSNIWQNWRVVSLLFRWDGKDHHLPLNICSVDLWDCSLVSWMLFWWIPRTCLCMWSQSPASAFFPWLSCLEMPGHYRLRFLEFVFLFPAMCICSLIFYFFFFLSVSAARLFFCAIWLLSPLPAALPVFPGYFPLAHNDNFTGVGHAAHHIYYLFEAKITAVKCELVPSPEAIFLLCKPHKTTEWKGTSWSLAPDASSAHRFSQCYCLSLWSVLKPPFF